MKRLKVFLCSTKYDLDLERRAVSEAIRLSEYDEISMELFGARPGTPIETCLANVERCDVMIVLAAFRYGTTVPRRVISFSEAEYRHGRSLRKPCFVYMPQNKPDNPDFVEDDPARLARLGRWKRALERHHTIYYYNDIEDLFAFVGRDLPGWIADSTGVRDVATGSAYLAMEQDELLKAVWVFAPHPLETLPDGFHTEIRNQVVKNLIAGVKYIYFVDTDEGVDRIARLAERMAGLAKLPYEQAMKIIRRNIEVCVLEDELFLTHYTVHIGRNGEVEAYQSVLDPDRRDQITKLSPPIARRTYISIRAKLEKTKRIQMQRLIVRKMVP